MLTKRNGATGIGYTLETLLGITENNIANPDILREMEQRV
ncbi:MAG: MvaI/BcnI family restriction endonuclease [Endomicrobium sp.]|nr:MvaI/BcnI family restriction endonuclease [Endomicrobium sp.]